MIIYSQLVSYIIVSGSFNSDALTVKPYCKVVVGSADADLCGFF